MILIIGNILALLISVALGAIGVRFLLNPRVAAEGYGVPAGSDGGSAYLSAKGARDISVALLGVVLVCFGGAHATGLFMLVMALIPLADAVIVTRNGGRRSIVLGVHFSTAVLVLIDSVLLLLS
ncbi:MULTISPECIES: DUF4267 domain-containing protein [Subtercola]|uniref:DUF4267 domain-containing protein n=1 Tax=Subtercola vilae TaxID=2056433 RepID=A0A4V4RG30_9MICO|nr:MULTISPECIES: DUF4267 domain-containing protein [Subtercola]MEA9984306.1 DUF4267 domain-containing protein [Subtercola sp. RTI3]TIH40124.1 DUF4267 domain-containing protein [Subtercola vilae]